ncbi:HAMP domain-containing sensor histidine kinase [Desulforamulus ruminis]|uniref:histidine kinase n=1 Tax=Desulforamulus ruminis (strain ATCC 23193 / DSM 2154 / NCIMB 8452 / DL) TaxID=696281 RepID=F6DQP3_DESRL|nr:HAMP domain-containing sensor histidine kinase [Desulforamulus ruminis]AEG62040.1 histidine kinase A domain protein [Desulforamulus ruminis DSM 2154]
MATRWKNKVGLVAWILLFTFGLSGTLSGVFHGSEYLQRDYFQTQRFDDQLSQFTDYLNLFELNNPGKEEMKKEITVTDDEVNEYRYRYGELPVQIADIQDQYEGKIQDALANRNNELANIYTAERDEKIKDITNNFKNDEYVREKIIKEKEQEIDEYFRNLESHRPEFTRLNTEFKYYLKDTATGEVFTNLTAVTDRNVDEWINSRNTLFIRSYPTAEQGYLSTGEQMNYWGYNETVDSFAKNRMFEGKIAVAKATAGASSIIRSYNGYQEKQRIFFIYALSSVIALGISIYLYKKIPLSQLVAGEKWQGAYNLIPIDVSVISLTFFGLFTLTLLTMNEVNGSPPVFIKETLFHAIGTALLVAITAVQGFFLWQRIMNGCGLKEEWRNSLLCRVYRGIKDAFLIRSVGIQVLIVLLLVFAFGAGIVIVGIEPRVLLVYAPVCLVIGLPMIYFIARSTGYFNRIVGHTGELVQGNLEPDLPVKGKSPLAHLAQHINALKHGVKTSQREQAKSERLKTELITNVSHDLRTPLTSVITYTELLKTPGLAEEDREAYIQIIDRKAKRLKVLIDDLFEASKMASGSIELVKDRVDLVQLLQQALAEHNETMSKSTLQIRVSKPDKPLYALVDGQKLWRVFDNLLVNIFKYSLENTRVYISAKALPDKAVIVFKNVAKYELGEDVDELFERFKRGDASRHTEGSGLGLAIAKSIVDLHGGSLEIEVDGDLFKTTVSLNTLD